jgi:hypothetical protein
MFHYITNTGLLIESPRRLDLRRKENAGFRLAQKGFITSRGFVMMSVQRKDLRRKENAGLKRL